MKRKIELTKPYMKEMVSQIKSGKINKSDLDELIEKIAAGTPLDSKYRDHDLAKHSPKEYQGCREFHYRPNICVIYKRTDDLVKLLRIGPHNKLGLTEAVNTTRN